MFGIEACLVAASAAKAMEAMTPEQRKQYIEIMQKTKQEPQKDDSSKGLIAGLVGFIFGLSI